MPTLTSANDLITAVPFLIGFHPTNSIVLVSVKDGAIGVAMRIFTAARFSNGESAELILYRCCHCHGDIKPV
ncbi:MAG: DUF4192 family protein, partial [Actinobacteria bacterium]|nr:DUF4192 family protein [Actinomycetota bacterium]